MKIAKYKRTLVSCLRSSFFLMAVLASLFTGAQTNSFKVAATLYPFDLLHNQYNALHGGIEVYRRPFSLQVSYGSNAGLKLNNRHESYQKGYKYKAGLRYYFSAKNIARTRLPSSYIQVLYAYLNYTQQRQNDHYTDLTGITWSYQTTQLATRRSGMEVLIGKNFAIYQRLMVDASAGMFLGQMANRYSSQTGVVEYTQPRDNPGWVITGNPKYRKEGSFFLARPAATIGITYWLR
jgi:hypothetical protein